ncbi:PD-(D/E)XK motif protein [Rhodococcus sp. TAF43]|uniref:PD-(D/E)XK motif protein n=1 Tax=Rhodococcus sp. TAF43 TaxID=3237483 RepID=UPI003F97422F
MAGSLRDVLIDHWKALESDRPTGAHRMRTSELPVDGNGGPLLAAVDADGLRHILVPILRNQRVRRQAEGVNLRVSERALETSSTYVRYADVSCLNRELNDLFSDVCSDVLLAVATMPSKALGATNHVLDRWRSLFATSTVVLRESRLTGLFAELWVLRRLLRQSSSAVWAWAGPAGHRHDFAFGADAFEVKATTATDGRRVRIHGLDQLDAPHNGSLFMTWMRLHQCTDGESLVDLVDDVLKLSDDQAALVDKLKRAGYRLDDSDWYRDVRFEVVEDAWYVVDTDFPRLTSAQLSDSGLPVCVSDVEYTIELPDPAASGLDASAVDALHARVTKDIAP